MTAKRRKRGDGRRLVLCAGVLLLLACAAAAAADVPLTGTVADAKGRPLAGADVALFEPLPPWRELAVLLSGDPPPPAHSTRTDGDGRFVLSAPAGVWRLDVAAPGHAPRSLMVPLAGEASEQGTVGLAADAGLEVTVLDAEGRPVEGARVAALIVDLADLLEAAPLHPRRARTDVEGRARLPRPEGMPAALAVAAPGFAPAMVELDGGDDTAVVRLAAGEPWAIEVLDPRRRPIAGAVVATAVPYLPLAITGDDGVARLHLPDRDPMHLTVVAAAGTAQLLADPERVPAGEPAPRRAAGTLTPWHTLAGRVLGAGDRRPLAGAVVWHLFQPGLPAITGLDGGFSLPLDDSGAHDDTWLIGAAAPAHRSDGKPVEHGTEAVEMSLSPLAGVAGRVVGEDGEPIAGASLVANPDSLFGLRGGDRAWSGADGRFVFRRLEAEKTHEVRVTHPELPAAEVEVKAPAAGTTTPDVRITLARGSRVRGRVYAADGRPLPGAEARLVRADRYRDDGPQPPRTRTGDDGRFTIERVLPGTYELHVAGAGHAPFRLGEVEVPKPPAERDVGRLELGAGARITGRVVDAEGGPVAGATLYRAVDLTTLLSGRAEVEELATSEADGRFVISDLEPDSSLGLLVEAPGFVSVPLDGVRAPPESPLHVVLERAATVAGQVVDGEGVGVAGAMVTIGNGEAGNLGMTDPDGWFVVAGLPPGEVQLQVHAGPASPPEPMALELEPGERREGVRIELERGGALVGRVTGSDGAPLAEATVRAAPAGSWPGLPAETDADGRYRIGGLPPGALEVHVDQPGHLPAVREIEGGPGEVRLDFELGEGHRVAGRVIDATGAPVAEAEVELRHPVLRARPEPATTGPDGRFELAGIAPGEWRLLASKRGYVRSEQPLAIEGPIDGIELRLGEGAAIAGQVRGLDSADLSRLHVSAMSPGLGRHAGEVDAAGAYRIGGLPPAPWHVTAELGPGEGNAGGTITLTGEEEARLDLDFGGLVLRGRVTLAGSPIGGAYITWAGLDAAVSGRLLTDADGRFRLARLAPGRYRLDVAGSHPEVVHHLEVDLDGDREVAVELAVGEVAGRAVDADTRQPLAGARIRLWGDGARYGTGSLAAVTGRDGTFHATRVAAGSYRLVAESDGYAVANVDLDVAPGGGVEDIEVTLHRSLGAVLVVSSPYGPPHRVSCAAVPAGSPPPPPDRPALAVAYRWAVPGESGRVELATLPAGRWRVHVSAINLAAAAVEVVVPGPPVPVALTLQAVLDVRVPALFRSGVGARVRLLAADGQPLILPGYGDVVETAWPLDFGRRHLEHVPPGSWTVEVTADDGRMWTRPITAVAGAATEVVVE